MSGPAGTALLDDFNRANGALGTNWTTLGIESVHGLQIVSNVVIPQSGQPGGEGYWNASTFHDCEVYATIGTLGGTDADVALYMRLTTPGISTSDGYLFGHQAGGFSTIFIARLDNGVRTALGSTGSDIASAGDSFAVQAHDSHFTAWKRPTGGLFWTLLFERLDSTYDNAGYLGLKAGGSVASPQSWDDFGGGAIASEATGPGRRGWY